MGKEHLGRAKCMSKQGRGEVNIVLICKKTYLKIGSQNLEEVTKSGLIFPPLSLPPGLKAGGRHSLLKEYLEQHTLTLRG